MTTIERKGAHRLAACKLQSHLLARCGCCASCGVERGRCAEVEDTLDDAAKWHYARAVADLFRPPLTGTSNFWTASGITGVYPGKQWPFTLSQTT